MTFHVIELYENPVSHKVDATVLYEIPRHIELKRESGMFMNRQAAHKWVADKKRVWITARFRNYVEHKNRLSACTNYYNTVGKREALQHCIQTDERIIACKDLLQVCNMIVQEEKNMRFILPGPGNPAFKNSEWEMQDILSFCREELHFRFHTPEVYQNYHHQAKCKAV